MNEIKIKHVQSHLVESGVAYDENVSLATLSYFQSGGLARMVVYLASSREVSRFTRFMRANEYDYKLIGDTSNLLFLDDQDYGVLVSLRGFKHAEYNRGDAEIYAEAGVSLPALTRKALVWGLTGFEGLEGIPGSLGGALFMNAGAYESEIKDLLLEVRGVKANGDAFSLMKNELNMDNRNSLFRENPGQYIILSARFRAVVDEPEKIFSKMELYHAKRHRYQDFIYPTLGSVFSTRDIYADLGHNDRKYSLLLKLVRRIGYSKKFRRETPMNKRLLNRFVCDYFGWAHDIKPYSEKTLNCIANRGQHTDFFIEYIDQLRQQLPASARLENEIMDSFFYESN